MRPTNSARPARSAARLSALAALILTTSLGGVAVAQSWSAAQPSADDLRYRLSVIDAEVQQLKAQIGGAGVSSGGGTVPASGDALVRIQRLEAEISRLTGQVEELRFRIDQVSNDSTRRFGDIEFRLTELEGGDISALGQTPPVGGAPAAVGTSDPGTQLATTGPEVSVSERSDLDRAIRDVQQGRFDQAEDRLRRFLNDYPRSPLESEAQFWMGESQFVRGAFQEAARSYLGGYEVDRQGPLAARNLVKLGVTLGRLGQVREACLTLNEVSNQFSSDSRAVGEAQAEAQRLGCS